MTGILRTVFFVSFAMWLVGCSALRPVPPATTATSFRSSIESQTKERPITLDHTKATFGTLFIGTRDKSNQKNGQQWAYTEGAALGGFAAVLGQLASKTGLLNTGLGLTMGSLALQGLYDPAKTEETHLSAEEMFVCMQRELGPVSEELRLKALKAEKGSAQATTTVDDVIARVDEAIFLYRKAILTQASTAPTKDDYARFAREYAQKEAEAIKQTNDASDEKRIALRGQDAALKLQREAQAALKVNLNDQAATGRQSAATLEIQRIQLMIEDAEIKAAGAKFISLSTNLEICTKQFKK